MSEYKPRLNYKVACLFIKKIYEKENIPNVKFKKDYLEDIIDQSINKRFTNNRNVPFPPSIFAKMAYFTANFIKDDVSEAYFPKTSEMFKHGLLPYRENKYFSSSYVAFNYSLWCIKESEITSNSTIVSKPLSVSYHSLLSILHTFSMNVSVKHTSIVERVYSLLYEQITYKTNPHIQYANKLSVD